MAYGGLFRLSIVKQQQYILYSNYDNKNWRGWATGTAWFSCLCCGTLSHANNT